MSSIPPHDGAGAARARDEQPTATRDPGAVTAAELNFDDYGVVLRDKSAAELRAANLVMRTIQSPWLMRLGTGLARAGLSLRLPGTAAAIEHTVFRQFCGGTDLDEALATASRLHGSGVGSILDYAVESEDSEQDSDRVRDALLDTVERAAGRPEIGFCATKLTGLARFALLENAHARTLADGEADELARARARVESVVARAAARGVAVFVDAEHSWVQGPIDAIVEDLMRRYNRERPVVHTTVQLYLRDRLDYLRGLIADARARGYRLGVKLVRGAYLEMEHERATERGYPSPVQPSKADTDRAFDAAITSCLEAIEDVSVCVATHNADSVRHLVAEMARLDIARGDARVTVSQLLGMFDRLTYPLAHAGYNALKYVPFGAVRQAFPYLLRRADENRSVASQLRPELEAIRAELRRRGRWTV